MTFSQKPLYPANGCLLPTEERDGLLDAYATGELSPEEQQQIASHIAQCESCKHTLIELQQYRNLLQGLFSDTPAPASQHESAQESGPHPTPLLTSRRQRLKRPIVRALLVAIALLVVVTNIFLARVFLTPASDKTASKSHVNNTSSSNATGNWQTLLTFPPVPAIRENYDSQSYPLSIPATASSPADPKTLYLCRIHLSRGHTLLPFTVQHLLYRSDDLGAHWQELALPAPAAGCEIRPDPVKSNIVVLLDDRNGNFISQDRGQHWQHIPPPPGDTDPDAKMLQATSIGGRIYVSGYWTTDLQTWTRWYPLSVSAQTSDEQQNPYPIDLRFLVDPRHPDTIYTDMSPTCPGVKLPAGFPSAGSVLCRSDDAGQSWHLLAGIPLGPGTLDPTYCLAQGYPDTLYVRGIQPFDATKGGLMRSSDGGASWEILHLSSDQDAEITLRCSAYNDRYPYNAQFQGNVTYSVSNSNFTFVDINNLPSRKAYNFALAENGMLYHASNAPVSGNQGAIPAGISVLSGTHWNHLAPLPPAYIIGQSQHKPPSYYMMAIQVLTSQGSSPVILAYDNEHLYRYISQ